MDKVVGYGVFYLNDHSDTTVSNPVGLPGRRATFTNREGETVNGELVHSATLYSEACQYVRKVHRDGALPDGRECPPHRIAIFDLAVRPNVQTPIKFA